MSEILKATNLTKTYGSTHAMRGISLDVSRGEALAIMGPSGSGKSTLLHALAGIELPDSGTVSFNGLELTTMSDAERTILRRRDFGFVFQFSQLVPELTALDNVAVPLLLDGMAKSKAYYQAAEWLEKVGLYDHAQSLPGQLSGGEAQRVAIARALCPKPSVLFADEPTGALDSLNSESVMTMFMDIARNTGMTVVMVTHEPLIAAYADREVIVRDGLLEG
ncbi:ABC transporter ATP-binding protein [Arcanobacterium haemolyticum]|uniref:ABC transporter related protein n=1 Tax=Arcanobacterium haemolyticum (strain ATCC 9345 / DSM 20595 / CCM 5947 / CCUG 17215 / LMG 16163 / NBRC 15585 / NCTC 8452 / 11018) TaxID=644284 RepID=D7BMK9_ARCHD|nr:ABC transporter ATP-binding protein [Arcanobacterium haemolyticum]ADH92158.1 ABC transporter related protein [Arcanobacterium haemolyticum DSM 20595]QCX46318.1 ABC transporter ATP-binding protein [Arcanobacterium haemolyticum]SQH29137.1 Lipoprotein-releasing system ATP-binding protein LolD [Arcanobacterium haemolyticum]